MQDDLTKKPNPGERMLSVLCLDDLTPTERLVMAALAYHDGPGGCKPGLERLAGILGFNRYKVNNYINDLVEKGRVQKQRGQAANIYIINYDPSTVRESLTVNEQASTVRKFPDSTVRKSLTQREEGKKGRRESDPKQESYIQHGEKGGDGGMPSNPPVTPLSFQSETARKNIAQIRDMLKPTSEVNDHDTD